MTWRPTTEQDRRDRRLVGIANMMGRHARVVIVNMPQRFRCRWDEAKTLLQWNLVTLSKKGWGWAIVERTELGEAFVEFFLERERTA